ncbi:hypothetical protein LIT25_02635 [Bacillus sp. F19]|nr:hypothetical protein LIT25_02635 [Bacillus sp. F19]
MRKGKFGVYQGKEYKIISYKKNYYLKSIDPLTQAIGFSLAPGENSIYIKKVEPNDLDDAYEIIPTTFYKGYHFGIIGYDEAKQEVILMTSNPEAWKKLNLETHAKYEFTVDVPLNELDIIEEKEPILGFGEK